MKKLLSLVAVSALFCNVAHADRIIILDDNNNVKQEIYTQSMAQPVAQPVAVAPTTYVQPQPVYVQQPAQQVVVVRPRPVARSYYYDSAATSLLAGFTGAIIGNAIFHGGHHHHGHRHHRH
ncbi:MAG: hypothetical protein J6N49_00870 [Alphaproteobacteria bacterium]|nr:hypothetical protein [Alphaproteobacteria bacterium]